MSNACATLTYGHEVEIPGLWRPRRLRGLDLRYREGGDVGAGVVAVRAYTAHGSERHDVLSIPLEEVRRLARLLDRIADEVAAVTAA